MKRSFLFITLLFVSVFMASSQVADRDRSKYAVNNFAEDDKYTMLQPYETVSVREPDGTKVKNVILMIGDGMGLEQISAAWVCNGGKLNLDNFTNVGIQRTYSADKLITDSAAAGTALATGHKTNNGMVSMTPDGTAVKSLAEEAMEKGMRAGAAVTCRVNDATPAVFFSHSATRKNQEDIVEQMANSGVYFLSGGGTKFWRDREDGKDITEVVKAKGYSYVETKEDLMAVESGPVVALMDSYELKHSLDRGDILPASVAKALELLDNENGFFLMVEGSMIDDGGHDNKAGHTMEEIFDFDRTLGIVLEWAEKDGETLVVVTGDHATGGMTLLGGSLGGKRIHVNYSTAGHNGIALPVFAWGPHSEDFVGIYENTELSDRIRKLIAKADLPAMGGYTVYDVDVEELSGLCLNHDGTSLIACGDQGVVKSISFDGKVKTMLAHDLDMEGITLHPSTGNLYLAVEGRQEVHMVAAPDHKVVTKAFPVQEAIEENYKNGGIEAVEFYKDDILFVGSQKEVNLWQYKTDGTLVSKISLSPFATEIAGLCYDSVADRLWVTDSNEARILLCTPEGVLLNAYEVPFVENLESICVDRERGCVWVGSDEDSPKLYRIDFKF